MCNHSFLGMVCGKQKDTYMRVGTDAIVSAAITETVSGNCFIII